MNLRAKTLLILLVTLVGLFIALYIAFHSLLSLKYLWIYLIATNLIFGVIVFFFIDRIVFIPLAEMSKHVRKIGEKGDLAARLPIKGSDELASLGASINNMLGDLQKSTQNLDYRLHQIHSATEISRIISGVLDPVDLMERVVELLEERFELYFVGIFLMDERNEMAVLRVASGEAGRKMLAEGYKLTLGIESLIGSAIEKHKPVLAVDVGSNAVHFNYPFLPLTRSELVLPLISGESVLGAISLQSKSSVAFDDEDVIMFMGIADTLTTALENARLFQQVQSSLHEINTLNRQYMSEGWSKVLADQGKIAFDYENRSANISDEGLKRLDIPLRLRQHNIGSLSLETGRANWLPEELVFIEAVTTQASLALENVRLLEDAQIRARRDRLVADISRVARGTTDMDAILRNTVLELGKALSASDGLIRLEMFEPAPSPESQNGNGNKPGLPDWPVASVEEAEG